MNFFFSTLIPDLKNSKNINKDCNYLRTSFNLQTKKSPKNPQIANFVRCLKFLNRKRGSSPVSGSGRTVEILVDFSSTGLEEAKH